MTKKTSRTSRWAKRQELRKKQEELIKEKGAEAVYGVETRVKSQRQLWRHGGANRSVIQNNFKDKIVVPDKNIVKHGGDIVVEKAIPNGVNVNDADVEAGLELVVPVGDLVPQNKKDEVTVVPRIQNPLHKFESVNCIFTLAALTLDEVNFPDETIMKRPPEFIVAKSAGGSSRESTLVKNEKDLKFEYYIDNVNIEAIIHSNSATGHTQGTNITFTVHEPFSLGLFLQNLQFQVAKAAKTTDPDNMANYLTHPMCLILEYRGSATEKVTPEEESQLRKVMPIRLKRVNFGNSNGISTYECEALALNDVAFSDQYATIPNDITITGDTVAEVLWSGEKSLAGILNNKVIQIQKDLKKNKAYMRKKARHGKARADKALERMAKLTKLTSIRDFMFIFPDKASEASAMISKRAKETDSKIVDTGDEPVQVPYATRLTNIFNFMYDSKFSYNIEEGFTGSQLVLNKIGKARMVIDHLKLPEDTGKEFADDSDKNENEYYDKDNKLLKTGAAKIDTKKKTISFKKGTHIVKIIEDIILLSEYGQDLDKRREAEPGLIEWFKIVPGRYIFADQSIKAKYNTYPEVLMFRIIPYFVPDDKFMAPDETSRANMLDAFIRKEYNILYTGNNKDVIDFNVEFNNAFFTAIMQDLGQFSPDSQDNATSKVDQDKEKSTAGTGSSTSSYSGNGINPEVTFGDPSRVDGGNAETLELRIARQFNKAILDSAVDLVKLDLNIVGDPYYIPQSGFGNYVASREDVTQTKFKDKDANADFLRGIVLTKVNFRTPIDIGDGSGKMLFSDLKTEKLQTLGEFSGYYYPIRVTSSFAGNKFVQEIEMIRTKTSVEGEETKTKAEPMVTEKPSKGGNTYTGQTKSDEELGISEETHSFSFDPELSGP